MPQEFKLANNLLIKQEDSPQPNSHNSMEITQAMRTRLTTIARSKVEKMGVKIQQLPIDSHHSCRVVFFFAHCSSPIVSIERKRVSKTSDYQQALSKGSTTETFRPMFLRIAIAHH